MGPCGAAEPRRLWLRHPRAGIADQPLAQRDYIAPYVADTTSILALIEARFGLRALQQRDAQAYNLIDGLDFTQKARPPAFG